MRPNAPSDPQMFTQWTTIKRQNLFSKLVSIEKILGGLHIPLIRQYFSLKECA